MKAYPITVLCAVMRVSRSGFYDYLDRYTSGDDKRSDDPELTSRIKEIFNRSRGSYGSRRILKQLQAEGYEIGRFKVRRIMRQLGLKARTPKRFKLTTDSKHSFPVAANVLDRKFDVEAPNKVWTADISVLQQRGMHWVTVLREKLHERWRNRPSEVCLQGPASNHLRRHGSKVLVVSVEGKGVMNTSGMNREGEHP
jgi:hypothetical protein